jgi:hypothetical protein
MMVLGRVDNMSNDYSPAANTLSIAFDNGNGVGDSINFTYHGVITEGEAMNLQEDYGYHPAGYGFYGFSVENGVTTWECQRSCD